MAQMNTKLLLLFLVALLIGVLASWLSAKRNWIIQDSKNSKAELQAQELIRQAEVESQPDVARVIPEGFILSPAPFSQLDTPPAEVVVTFPFQPKSGDVIVNYNDVDLTLPDDTLSVRDNSFVYPLPATASSGIYTVRYSGCPDEASANGCISGTYGFSVK